MSKEQRLPIGIDEFREIREKRFYYIDKTMIIEDFIKMQDKVTLIARPRRFGKTLNMTMIREFFDITVDSKVIFNGLAIMDSEYAVQINTKPVIFLTLKDCKASSAYELMERLKRELYKEYLRYEELLSGKWVIGSYAHKDFYRMIEALRNPDSPSVSYVSALQDLTCFVKKFYHTAPILLIDEYDQPIMSSYEHGYHEQIGDFFSNFYGSAMKGNPCISQALLTGVQRVAKESIFSQFNNARVYTVLHKQYSSYFGFTVPETQQILVDYGLSLNQEVQKKYNGYRFGGVETYNPWSILNYADMGNLDNYWVNTSSNYLVKKALKAASVAFWDEFDKLVSGNEITVWITLETSYIERDGDHSLWGLLVNSGYLTALQRIDAKTAVLKIPNDEVMSEFQLLIAEISGINGVDLERMLSYLLNKEMEQFFHLYQNIVIACTSYMDAKENAYHMLFLGMCIALRGAYKVMSNIEAGYGRSDITLESMNPSNSHVIIEFKQGKDIDRLKEEALQQILDNRYYAGLKGEVICVGLAHDKKVCSMIHKVVKPDI